MNIVIASDHGGFDMKEAVIKHYANKKVNIVDLGCFSNESVDYPDFAELLCNEIINKNADRGILICGTGIGISIAANRNKGIRAALLYSDEVAKLSRQHNDANVAVFGGRTMSFDEIVKRVDIFLNEEFEGGRHSRRIGKLDK